MNFDPDHALVHAFTHAADVCECLDRSMRLNEETMTSAMLGALAATLPMKVSKHGAPAEFWPPCFWGMYNKGVALDPHSEARNGADFALIVLGTNNFVRLAIFQAKRGVAKKSTEIDGLWSLNVRRIRKAADGSKYRQMVALAQAAANFLWKKSGAAPVERLFKKFNWVHYVVYGPGAPVCVALNRMLGIYQNELDASSVRVGVPFHPTTTIRFFDVMKDGVGSGKGWLTLDISEALDALPPLVPLMRVLIVGGSKGWDLIPSAQKSNFQMISAAAAQAAGSPRLK